MTIKSFLTIGVLEGISSLLLFFVAMPLKYVAGIPEAVKYTGWAHGLLFVVFLGAAALMTMERKWKFTSLLILFVAAILPGGPLFLDKWVLRREGENV
jgi:integral membrane protein